MQSSACAVVVHEPALVVADTNVTLAGAASDTFTFAAASGPLFFDDEVVGDRRRATALRQLHLRRRRLRHGDVRGSETCGGGGVWFTVTVASSSIRSTGWSSSSTPVAVTTSVSVCETVAVNEHVYDALGRIWREPAGPAVDAVLEGARALPVHVAVDRVGQRLDVDRVDCRVVPDDDRERHRPAVLNDGRVRRLRDGDRRRDVRDRHGRVVRAGHRMSVIVRAGDRDQVVDQVARIALHAHGERAGDRLGRVERERQPVALAVLDVAVEVGDRRHRPRRRITVELHLVDEARRRDRDAVRGDVFFTTTV